LATTMRIFLAVSVGTIGSTGNAVSWLNRS
jgi:hypothetical protein